jgi:transposase
MLPVKQQVRIRNLFYAEHWKVGTIAAELGLHPDAVKRAIEAERFGVRRRTPYSSMLDPYKPFIIDILDKHPRLRATRIFQMLRLRGYPGAIAVLRRYVRQVRPAPSKEAYLRLQTMPGEQGQVDWANFGKLQVGETPRTLSCFVLVLSYSRAMYARFALDQSLESFLRGHVEAFEYLGGAPRTLLYDNLKSVVLERDGEHVRFHPHLLEIAGHYHFTPKPCAPYRGNEKGKVERAIQYLRTSFFPARHFASIHELNDQLKRWLSEVAEQRSRPTDADHRTVGECLKQERELLLELPQHRFDCDLVLAVKSRKQPYIRFDKNDYSIPHQLVGKPLTLIASEHTVRILDDGQQVAQHQRSYDRGKTVQDEQHLRALARQKKEAAQLSGRDLLRSVCPHANAFIAQLAQRGNPFGPQTSRLLKLLDRYGAAELDTAIAEALQRNAIGASAVAHICDQRRYQRGQPPLLPPVISQQIRDRDVHITPHDLNSYDRLDETLNDSEDKS